jgi:hypothetical protein
MNFVGEVSASFAGVCSWVLRMLEEPSQVEEYLARAAGLRALANKTRYHDVRERLLRLAAGFEWLADQAGEVGKRAASEGDRLAPVPEPLQSRWVWRGADYGRRLFAFYLARQSFVLAGHVEQTVADLGDRFFLRPLPELSCLLAIVR